MTYRALAIIISCFIISCNENRQTENSLNKTIDSNQTAAFAIANAEQSINDKSINFLWRANQYDAQLKDSVSTIIINQDFCNSISDPEKAALGFVATFIGSDCDFDGPPTEDYSNLKCKIISALDLGSQCSEQHLGFLRKWFANDAESLKKLKDCPQVPASATSQNTFDEIKLSVKSDSIFVWFKANGINLGSGESWSWTEENIFKLSGNSINMIKINKSEFKREKI